MISVFTPHYLSNKLAVCSSILQVLPLFQICEVLSTHFGPQMRFTQAGVLCFFYFIFFFFTVTPRPKVHALLAPVFHYNL